MNLRPYGIEDRMEKAWQDVLDRFPYGIYLLTVSSAEGDNGMIVSWVTQCSHEPPLLALAIRKSRLAHGQILQGGRFCLNVLPKEAADAIGQFKIADWQKKFDPFPRRTSPSGLPVLENCIGYLDCSLEKTVDTGDHTLFIGKITGGAILNGDFTTPLSTADYSGVYRGTR